ncbi:MAG: hypothetical protein JSS53_00560 [Proteobacteria bacterium]|nr:hypothetical protein [Pseudomonadota bacterium]
MHWQTLGFKDDPLKTTPITSETLALYTGHSQEVKTCQNVLTSSNVRIVIEGARGVGTTSFGNYLRFTTKNNKHYFTTKNEIKIDQGWRLETLLAVIISHLVRELELFANNSAITKDPRFHNAKAISSRIAETYRSFGIEAFGAGINYGKTAGVVTQPIIIPSATLSHLIEDLVALIRENGYKHGVLLQLNNLDVGVVHTEQEMKYLFNALRDYTQIDGTNWLFVGDIGLRKFIAQQVDRMDDIISYEVKINPLNKEEFTEMLTKRFEYYRNSPKTEIPIEMEVFTYLYQITSGRLRYIFGLVSRLMNSLHVGDLTNKITIDLAKPMLIKLARDRVERTDITSAEENVLKILVNLKNPIPNDVAKIIKKTPQYVGRVISVLHEKQLITIKQAGKLKYYYPSLDATIAYSDI